MKKNLFYLLVMGMIAIFLTVGCSTTKMGLNAHTSPSENQEVVKESLNFDDYQFVTEMEVVVFNDSANHPKGTSRAVKWYKNDNMKQIISQMSLYNLTEEDQKIYDEQSWEDSQTYFIDKYFTEEMGIYLMKNKPTSLGDFHKDGTCAYKLWKSKKKGVDIAKYANVTTLSFDTENAIITDEKDAIRINLDGNVLFESGSATVSPEMIEALKKAGSEIKKVKNMVKIGGHTDKQPCCRDKKWKNNMALSLARAEAVRDILLEAGVPTEQMTVEGFGDTIPLVESKKVNVKENRRVEILIQKVGPDGTIIKVN